MITVNVDFFAPLNVHTSSSWTYDDSGLGMMCGALFSVFLITSYKGHSHM